MVKKGGSSTDGPTSGVRLPNFLIVGAAKSGTTALYHYLRKHPEIYMPFVKEPRFFVASVYRDINPEDALYEVRNRYTAFSFKQYARLFQEATTETAVGEASVQYLYYHTIAIPEIKKYLGDVKIIIILRNPVERAFSAYTHLLRDGSEVLPFEACLGREEERRKGNWGMINFYKDAGFYSGQVRAYMDSFSCVKVVLFDDLRRDALGLVRAMYDFLGVDQSFVPDFKNRYNVSGVPRSTFLHKFLERPSPLQNMIRAFAKRVSAEERIVNLGKYVQAKNLTKPVMKPETRAFLKELYRDEIVRLQELLKRDLSTWLT